MNLFRSSSTSMAGVSTMATNKIPCVAICILAKYGFAVVNANYRLVPQIGFQGQLHDALDAIIWTNEHAHDYGMDTNALFLIGDSAATLLILYLTAVLHLAGHRHSLA